MDFHLQEQIIARHMANDMPFLLKDSVPYISFGGDNAVSLSGGYELRGMSNSEQYPFLPHFEFAVGTAYEIELHDYIPGGESTTGPKGITASIIGKDRRLAQVAIRQPDGLFSLRNSSHLPISSAAGLASLVDAEAVTGFYLEASSETYGKVIGEINLASPHAEQIIDDFLSTIDKMFGDYKVLENLVGNPQYNAILKQLNKGMFQALARIVKAGRTYRHYKADSKISYYWNMAKEIAWWLRARKLKLSA